MLLVSVVPRPKPEFMMPRRWQDPRHVITACHMGFLANFASSNKSTTSCSGTNLHTSVSPLASDFFFFYCKTNPPQTLCHRSASRVFWERQRHDWRVVIIIWLGNCMALSHWVSLYHAVKSHQQSSKNTHANKTGWCWASNFCFIHFPDPITCHCGKRLRGAPSYVSHP